MPKPKVLYICHGHPDVRPGGAETYALELYQGMRDQGDFEPILLAKGHGRPHAGTNVGPISGDPNQYFLYTEGYSYDLLFGTMDGKEFYAKHLHDFLLAIRPDIVHFQHTLFLGYDTIREVKNTLPAAPIIYTLHEYLPICHRQGQMVRTINNEERCDKESPGRCHECFPEISTETFFMRKRFIQSHLSLVDIFLAPSRFLQGRFVAWGLPEGKIRLEEYGRRPFEPVPESCGQRPRTRFAYFGQINPYKGVDVLLKAMKSLVNSSAGAAPAPGRARTSAAMTPHYSPNRITEPHLWIHGANLDLQQGNYQKEFRSLLESAGYNVTFVGPYQHGELPRLMANIDWVVVPSIWWENSPLVIQEAFGFGKPVLCSDIGAMAEKVTDRVNGLHFCAGDPISLARTIQEAATAPGLWDTLRQGIPGCHRMNNHVQTLINLYRELLDRSKGANHLAKALIG